MKRLPAHQRMRRVPPGGLTSLLYHFISALEDIKNCLADLEGGNLWDRLLGACRQHGWIERVM